MASSINSGSDAEDPSKVESGGLDLAFVNDPPDDLMCSICLFVHREPVLTGCCGNHFCFSCVEQVRLEQRPCPLCGAQHFTIMLDKYFVRKVNELKVLCKHKEMGCLWQGAVIDLKRHLDPHSGDCKCIRMECPYLCGTLLVASELDRHQNVCHKRPYTCKFCDYKGVYEDMSAKHWRVCEKYPLPCPSSCGEAGIERRLMEKHLSEDCSVHRRDCDFGYAGCTQHVSSSDMSKHMSSNLQYHLSLLSKHCLHLSESFSSEICSKMEQEIKSNDSKLVSLQTKLKESEGEISFLKSKLDSLEDEVDDLKIDNIRLKSIVFVPPFEFIMVRFREYSQNQQQWLSPAFYSHFGGYRMCIGVDANGSEEGQDTHVSVYVNLMKGEYDDRLKWPFKGCISVELCNQRGTSGNFREEVVFTYDARDIASRVTNADIADHGLGIPTFIKHSQLSLHTTKGAEVQYLRNDCLRFRVLKVDLMERRNTSTK